MDIDWVRDGSGGGRESERGWLLTTVGADGKVSFSLCVYVSVPLSVPLSVSLPLYLSVCLSFQLSVCFSRTQRTSSVSTTSIFSLSG